MFLPEDQVNIYDYFGVEDDPLYQKLYSLGKGDSVYVGEYHVFLNEMDIYEISGPETHQGTSSFQKCFDFFSKLEGEKI